MEYITQLATVAVVLLFACISPGPDFVAVTSHALSSRRSGLRMAFGVSAAIVVWSTVAICGLALILAKIDWLYEIVRLAGAVYLVYLGIHLLIAARQPHTASPDITRRATAGSFRRGFVIGITNPKTAAFFSSLFATVLPAGAPVWVYIATVLIAGVVSTGWFTVLAVTFSVAAVQRVYRRARRWIDATMGAVLTAIGVRLALSQ